MTDPDSVLKSRDIALLTKVCNSQGCFSSSQVQKWELDHKGGWALKSWCFQTVVLEKRVPWTARRSNQSILKEINPEYSLEGLMLKPKLQYFGHLMWRPDSWEKTMMLEKIKSKRRRGGRGWNRNQTVSDEIHPPLSPAKGCLLSTVLTHFMGI